MTAAGPLAITAPTLAFEPCDEDSCWDDLWYVSNGHHTDGSVLRRHLMRALRRDYNPGEGIAAMTRRAEIIHGWLGELPGKHDHVAVTEAGVPVITIYDDEDEEITQATTWWPATWAVIRER